MSVITQQPGSTEDTISNNGFWPDLSMADYKTVMRDDGVVDNGRLRHQLNTARLRVNRRLLDYVTKADTETETNKDVLHWYKTAVYETTKARLIENYRDTDTREKGSERADRMMERITTAYSNATQAISEITGNGSRFKSYVL